MCAACAAEYHDPIDRRFHAQPLACAACGPAVRFEGLDGLTEAGDGAIAATQRALAEGLIVAVKGLGGFHLACAAASDDALRRLRARKGRPEKPFAVMARDLATAERVARVDAGEAALLGSVIHPIVLLRRAADGAQLSELVAPGHPLMGVFLPYTPLHHLLFHAVPGATGPVPDLLVMTSGNLTDEPICYDDDEARARLGRIADAWLVHDRPIHVPCDDSVVRVVDGEELPIRRSRGYAPLPLALPVEAPPVLAVGGELKNTFCLASGRDAWMSQHIGDMGSVETFDAFERSARQFVTMYEVRPRIIAADAHPGYHTRRWAEERGLDVVLVQHHHAHVAAAMAEHGVSDGERVIGVAFDGTGYGTDGAMWGGEVLVAGFDTCRRAAHLRYVPMPGGDAAIRRPAWSALAHLWAARVPWTTDLAPVRATDETTLAALARQLDQGYRCVPCSSMGRLFDAVGSLLDLRHTISYEAQVAVELEAIAEAHLATVGAAHARRYDFNVAGNELDAGPVIAAIATDVCAGRERGAIAAGFHLAVATMVADTATALGGRDRLGAGGPDRRGVSERGAAAPVQIGLGAARPPTTRAPARTAQ